MDIRNYVEKFSSFASWTGVIATIIAVTSYYSVYQKELSEDLINNEIKKRDIYRVLEKVVNESQRDILKMKDELSMKVEVTSSVVEELKEQQQRLLLLASTQGMDSASQQEFIALVAERVASKLEQRSSPNKLEKRIKLIEEVVVQTPEKALQIPFIKKEVSGISKSIEKIENSLKSVDDSLDDIKVYRSQVESLTNQVNQTNNWMIGIFGALGVSVLGLLIGNVFQHRREKS